MIVSGLRSLFCRSRILLLVLCLLPSSINAQEISEVNGVYTLKTGDLLFSVSAPEGGRIISFQRSGEELLISNDIHPNYYGATLWPSPQRRFWPPSPTLDHKPYQVEITGNTLRLISDRDSLTGFRFTKEFSISFCDTAILINYTIENQTDSIQHVAAWDVARVAGGTTFFPVKDLSLKDLPSNLEHTCKDGVLWYQYSPEITKRGKKLFATTSEGWLAHQQGNLLFIKKFPMTVINKLPFRQGEVEIFLSPNSHYIELENHGAYTTLQAGESLNYRQKWYLIPMHKTNAKNQGRMVKTVRRLIGLGMD